MMTAFVLNLFLNDKFTSNNALIISIRDIA